MNKLDLYSPADPTAAEEAAYDNAVKVIDKFDGKALFESATIDVNELLDAFGLPDVFIDPAETGVTWDALTSGVRECWDDLAAVVRSFGFEHLDEDRAVEHANDLAA